MVLFSSAGVVLSTRETGNDITWNFATTLDNKTFILRTCIIWHEASKLHPHSSNKTLVQERIIKRRCIVPSVHLDLVSTRDAADGMGG